MSAKALLREVLAAGDKPVESVESRDSGGMGVTAGEDAHRPELRAADASELVGGEHRPASSRWRDDRVAEQRRRAVGIELRPALRLGDDPVDHAELEAVGGVGLEGGGGLLRLRRRRARGSPRSPRAR